MPGVGTALLAIPAGRAEALFGLDFAQVQQIVPALGAAAGRRVVLMQRFHRVPGAEELIDAVLATLATIAARMWPVWYTDIDFADLRPADLPDTTGRIAARLAGVLEASALWCERAAARRLAGRNLGGSDVAMETRLQQLALAISRHGLILTIAVADPTPVPGALRGLAHAAGWLARRGRLAVAVLVPATWADNPELVEIAPSSAVMAEAPTVSGAAGSNNFVMPETAVREPDDIWMWPVQQGRPHPNSPGEQILARALGADPELGPLFAFNRSAPTRFVSTPIVDLLWAEGRVVVEVDGDSHRQLLQYSADRQRDFELLVSGYLVLRLTHDEVMTDTARAVEKIRRVVNYRRTHFPEVLSS